MSAPPPLAAERVGTGTPTRPPATHEPEFRPPGEPLREEPGPGAARCLGLYAKLAAGVAVLTARGDDGPLGLTVSAVTSLSARPPLLLACLRDGSRTLAAVRAHGAFAVHLLREEQHGLAVRFARPDATAAQRFAGTDLRQVLGVPVLSGTLAWSVCLVEDVRRYGDHRLVVGQVAAVHVGGGRPLLWHDRRFRALTELAPDGAG
ncbi:flavin oxidoreductase [Streptomyces sp. AS58]|uniref:flavin reductase family protein n=1 Tax=Streptomyces sp. AS58 TaxID=1519489 RepID=UPI0006AFF4A4|nr:flavin reductase family protein [Streptomyces sp. AS58]KOV71380.1 flavin oxidoreductase [Streptomyces sp. AS58]